MHPQGEEVLKQMPQEICNLLSKFDLESHIVIYAVCPACNCTFEPQFPNGPDSPTYPSTCTNAPYPGTDICGVLGGRSLDSLMAQAWSRQEARWLCSGYATEQTTKTGLKLLLGPLTLHHLTWI